MSRVRSKPKSELEKLEQIDRINLKISERLAPLESEDALHIPRTGPFPRGRSPTVFGPGCEPSCPTCPLITKHYSRRSKLGDIRREALLEHARQSYREREAQRERNRKNARQPRRERESSLWRLGFQCALRENADHTAESLRDWLEGYPRTYDDYDIMLSLDGDDIVLENLNTDETETVKKSNQRVYLQRARNSM